MSDKVVVEVASSIEEYLDRSDWRVSANANQGYSLGGLILQTSGKVVANYWLSHVYPPEVGQAHREGDLHVHDLDMLSGYCAGWSLRTLLQEGLNGVPGKVDARPPRHFSAAVGQIVNFLGTMQNEWAGAQAFSSFDTYLAPYVRLDGLTYDAGAARASRSWSTTSTCRRGGARRRRSPTSRSTGCARTTCATRSRSSRSEPCDFTYGDLQVEMDMINRAYIEIMTTGDASGRVFTFPIPTYNITKDFDWDSENADRAVRDDRQVRAAVLPELPQLRAEPRRRAVDVLPPPAGPARAAQARQRPVRVRRADGLHRRRHHQLRAARATCTATTRTGLLASSTA